MYLEADLGLGKGKQGVEKLPNFFVHFQRIHGSQMKEN